MHLLRYLHPAQMHVRHCCGAYAVALIVTERNHVRRGYVTMEVKVPFAVIGHLWICSLPTAFSCECPFHHTSLCIQLIWPVPCDVDQHLCRQIWPWQGIQSPGPSLHQWYKYWRHQRRAWRACQHHCRRRVICCDLQCRCGCSEKRSAGSGSCRHAAGVRNWWPSERSGSRRWRRGKEWSSPGCRQGMYCTGSLMHCCKSVIQSDHALYLTNGCECLTPGIVA